jgi:hypothetical protein
MVAADVGTGEAAALSIMGIPLERVQHLRLAREEGMVPASTDVAWSADPTAFKGSDFTVRRSWLNWMSIGLAKLPACQRAIYHSGLSPAIYRLVNRLRPDSAQKDLSLSTPRRRGPVNRRG